VTAIVAWSASARIVREVSRVATHAAVISMEETWLMENQLKMHMQTHRERTVVCPVCRSESKKFKTGADAVLHLESGSCAGCKGKDNAKNAIYGFV